ncbi:hypothetical protein Ddc_14232 [Ditylenchus destructor]|nr:hypothetical protein Ddc_14232 [Ditylenchus destructor]
MHFGRHTRQLNSIMSNNLNRQTKTRQPQIPTHSNWSNIRNITRTFKTFAAKLLRSCHMERLNSCVPNRETCKYYPRTRKDETGPRHFQRVQTSGDENRQAPMKSILTEPCSLLAAMPEKCERKATL